MDERHHILLGALALPLAGVVLHLIVSMTRYRALRRREPAPEVEAVPMPEAEQPLPGYSLADELDRLIAAAAAPAPLLTPAEHEAVVSPAPVVEPEPVFEVKPEPLFPPPSVGRVLSAPVLSAPVSTAPAPAPEPGPEPVAVPAAQVPGYMLVGPVELHFTEGQGRIGVKPGTRSFVEFQRLAGILLDDLRSARGW
ncbi:MAG: hypothetical protein ACYCXZ_09640 [Coriobacteriia bacterium]